MVLCYGTTRTVLLIGKYALKFPSCSSWKLFLHGLLANMQEKSFSSMGIPELAPVVFSIWGGFLVVMPRAEVKSFDDPSRFDYLDSFFESIKLSVNFALIDDIVERKVCSVGLLNGKIVAVDYGS